MRSASAYPVRCHAIRPTSPPQAKIARDMNSVPLSLPHAGSVAAAGLWRIALRWIADEGFCWCADLMLSSRCVAPPLELLECPVEIVPPARCVGIWRETSIFLKYLVGMRNMDHRRNRQTAQLAEIRAHVDSGSRTAPLTGRICDNCARFEGKSRTSEVIQ